MDRDNTFVIIGAVFLIVVVFLIVGITNSPNKSGSMSGMAVYQQETCDDGTPVYKCSQDSLGNMCIPTKEGAELRFSEKCYE